LIGRESRGVVEKAFAFDERDQPWWEACSAPDGERCYWVGRRHGGTQDQADRQWHAWYDETHQRADSEGGDEYEKD
jgi:hypothetical protein